MERRRTLSNNENNKVVGYGGIITFSERPTEMVSFECPGCTHFAVMPLNVDAASGKFGALFINTTAIKDDYVAGAKTYQTGKGGLALPTGKRYMREQILTYLLRKLVLRWN